MIDLIKQNRFDELKDTLQHSKSFKIHPYLFQILNGTIIEVEAETFDADKYEEEFLEGFALYKAMLLSSVDKESLKNFMHVLVQLVFKMSGFIQLMAENAMQKGLDLSSIEHIYKVNPEVRNKIQEFIEILRDQSGEEKAIANLSAAKARISNGMGYTIEKYQIGEDMLQFAAAYEKVGETETAVKIHQGIMNDFKSASAKLGSGLFSDMIYADDRPESEIKIFSQAKENFERLTGQKVEEPKSVHINEDPAAKKLVETVRKEETRLSRDSEHETSASFTSNTAMPPSGSGFLAKIKKFFGKD